MEMTARARRQAASYEDKAHFMGFRKRALVKYGYSGTKNDGFCDAFNRNKHKASRVYKHVNHAKTPGRKPKWLDVVEITIDGHGHVPDESYKSYREYRGL